MPVDGASVFEAALGEERWLARGFRVCRETGTRILLRDCGALGRAPPCLVTRDVGRTIKEGFGGPLVRGVGSPLRTDLDMFEFLKKRLQRETVGGKTYFELKKRPRNLYLALRPGQISNILFFYFIF